MKSLNAGPDGVLGYSPNPVSEPQWTAQGPGLVNSSSGSATPQGNTVSGGIQSIAVDPHNPAHIIVGSVNGGVWQTFGGSTNNPTWTPLSDQLQSLSIGAVGKTNGITSAGSDVKLTVLSGGVAVNKSVSLGGGDLTINSTGAVTQTAGNVITAQGLQVLGSGTVNLDEANNNVATLAANYSGTISYRDLNSLTVGTVSDTSMGTTTMAG